MVQWAILAAVKVMKFSILAILSLVSHLADSESQDVSAVMDTVPAVEVAAVVIHTEDHAVIHAVPVRLCVPEAPEAPTAPAAVRVGRLVPALRVEMTFTPDLLVRPVRDPSL